MLKFRKKLKRIDELHTTISCILKEHFKAPNAEPSISYMSQWSGLQSFGPRSFFSSLLFLLGFDGSSSPSRVAHMYF
jgi:hypothetical protein